MFVKRLAHGEYSINISCCIPGHQAHSGKRERDSISILGGVEEAGRIRWAKIRLVRDFRFYFLNLGELLNIEEEYYGTTCRESV